MRILASVLQGEGCVKFQYLLDGCYGYPYAMHSVTNTYPIKIEAHRGVLDGEKVRKFIVEPSRLRVGYPKAP